MTWTLTAADGSTYESPTPGTYGGNRRQGVYGTLSCGVARDQRRRFPETMRAHRVFFADEETASAAGLRPCGSCLPDAYRAWKQRRGQ
ncbi:hypothetical protein GCM10011519_32050 [Marmoricola endophyticus]|uniref:Ada DNA repair metal-binding domain-containing protein n=1 Tax=Marmoricola endophyticus TaxID=2040280 RepID=A0A917F7H8_9ACTN|nr:Ada metal-binding domain-containing protein [Marmoricola endophyticus]GGF55706.1 hypothetical protein GCM10011519_32050 [Marmoricola endophyticus]